MLSEGSQQQGFRLEEEDLILGGESDQLVVVLDRLQEGGRNGQLAQLQLGLSHKQETTHPALL